MEIGNIKRIGAILQKKEGTEIFCALFCFYVFP